MSPVGLVSGSLQLIILPGQEWGQIRGCLRVRGACSAGTGSEEVAGVLPAVRMAAARRTWNSLGFAEKPRVCTPGDQA